MVYADISYFGKDFLSHLPTGWRHFEGKKHMHGILCNRKTLSLMNEFTI